MPYHSQKHYDLNVRKFTDRKLPFYNNLSRNENSFSWTTRQSEFCNKDASSTKQHKGSSNLKNNMLGNQNLNNSATAKVDKYYKEENSPSEVTVDNSDIPFSPDRRKTNIGNGGILSTTKTNGSKKSTQLEPTRKEWPIKNLNIVKDNSRSKSQDDLISQKDRVVGQSYLRIKDSGYKTARTKKINDNRLMFIRQDKEHAKINDRNSCDKNSNDQPNQGKFNNVQLLMKNRKHRPFSGTNASITLK